MNRTSPLIVALLGMVALSGCAGSDEPTDTQTTGPVPLGEGRGGVMGVLFDDVIRPVPNALILLQEAGLTATTDADGEFSFRDVIPDVYTLKVTVDRHEARPINVEVVEGEYAEVEVSARRVFSQGGSIITRQYSVFIACSAEALAASATGINCNLDATGDSTRTGYETDLRSEASNMTYMVTEIKFNQKGDYLVVIGLTDATNTYETYYAEADVKQGDYLRLVNRLGEVNNRTGENVGSRNVNFTVDPPFETTVFPHGPGYSVTNTICIPGNPATYPFCLAGAGPAIAVKANIVQSVFIGEPEHDIETYQVFAPSA